MAITQKLLVMQPPDFVWTMSETSKINFKKIRSKVSNYISTLKWPYMYSETIGHTASRFCVDIVSGQQNECSEKYFKGIKLHVHTKMAITQKLLVYSQLHMIEFWPKNMGTVHSMSFIWYMS